MVPRCDTSLRIGRCRYTGGDTVAWPGRMPGRSVVPSAVPKGCAGHVFFPQHSAEDESTLFFLLIIIITSSNHKQTNHPHLKHLATRENKASCLKRLCGSPPLA